MSNEEQGPTMEQMLMELMSAHADFITAKKDAWDYALKRRNEALSAALARYAELERERDAYRADAAIGAIARAHMCETGYGWQFKAFQVYGAPSLESLEDAAIAQRGGKGS